MSSYDFSALMNQEKNEEEKSACMPITWENYIVLVSQRINEVEGLLNLSYRKSWILGTLFIPNHFILEINAI